MKFKTCLLGLSFFGLSLIGLTACTTTPNMQQNLSPYLDQFIGKTAAEVKQNINFNKFNVQASKKPFSEANQVLVYRILRPMKIPLPSYTPISTGGTSGSTIIRPGSLAESYDVNLYCDIKFHLNNNHVSAWSYAGKAC